MYSAEYKASYNVTIAAQKYEYEATNGKDQHHVLR
jgi:hypothetical protein